MLPSSTIGSPLKVLVRTPKCEPECTIAKCTPLVLAFVNIAFHNIVQNHCHGIVQEKVTELDDAGKRL